MSSTDTISYRLLHHGAAASSAPHTLAWIPKPSHSSSPSSSSSSSPSSMIVYSSHSIINIASSKTTVLGNGTTDPVWHVHTTLRTKSIPGGKDDEIRSITSLACINSTTQSSEFCLVSGFSDGTVNAWRLAENCEDFLRCEEEILMDAPRSDDVGGCAVTDIDGIQLDHRKHIMVVTCRWDGAYLLTNHNNVAKRISSFAANSVRVEYMPFGKILILIGTASPRHNKIHLYMTSTESLLSQQTPSNDELNPLHYCGNLSGHEDWVTCFDWNIRNEENRLSCPTLLLASGSQDSKIRLWRFATSSRGTNTSSASDQQDIAMLTDAMDVTNDDVGSDDDDDDENDDDRELDEDGEARLEIATDDNAVTSIFLEALLIGHEESVTSVQFHPNPLTHYSQPNILISSSIDRTLLIWGPTIDGVWLPITRVGSAGGILGGSIGSTLLGFVGAAIDPIDGTRLVGHAYGGSLHFWSLENSQPQQGQGSGVAETNLSLSLEEMASQNKWKTNIGLTGHFDNVTDLVWESNHGDYLLTVGADQTCRLWSPVRTKASDKNGDIWVELARPQVHGYNLTAITSVSTPSHRHLIVSGADEKELRVFDAPMTTVRMLHAVKGGRDDFITQKDSDDIVARVERAYIPSLGLSNKATAADGAEEDAVNQHSEQGRHQQIRLPLERDLGVLSLWPEVRKLFGHNTELFCLASTSSSRAGSKFSRGKFANDDIVASAAKARDVEAANIRLWDVENGKCIQVLAGGHRSTVATLSFSPDSRYLASSGKDRRLCLWKREEGSGGEDTPAPSFSLAAAIDSAHKRIIWCVHFCPLVPTVLASGSRDGNIKIWHVADKSEMTESNETTQLKELYSFEPSCRMGKKAAPVTALAFAPRAFNTNQDNKVISMILAVGVENGLVELWEIPLDISNSEVCDEQTHACKLLHCIPKEFCHIASISKLAWRPNINEETGELLLASCSMDHGVRINSVSF